jgi:acetyltransferase-like isoleucine patch superfamily enzyme
MQSIKNATKPMPAPLDAATSKFSLPATKKNEEIIAKMKRVTAVKVPWCEWYERMISGMHFSTSFDTELLATRLFATKQCAKINDQSILQEEATTFVSWRLHRMQLLRETLGSIGANSLIDTPFFCQLGCNIIIGNDTFINYGVKFHDCAPITIGDRVMIGPDVKFITEGHSTDVGLRRARCLFAYPIEVGDDVWIGANVVILPGVKIGRGCTIAAGCLVNKDVPPFSVVGGVPARILKTVTDPDSEEGREKAAHLNRMMANLALGAETISGSTSSSGASQQETSVDEEDGGVPVTALVGGFDPVHTADVNSSASDDS